ncbi:MAG: TPM domain-containing protein [Victivallaceae bacterium]|nr:TPM domain-containing protein [Victivallaceae bacterium]
MAGLLDKISESKIIAAIKQAEKETSGEIRVHLQKKLKDPIMLAARQRFELLGMDATELKNGVLIFVAVKAKQLAIIGDKGIDDCVPDDFWEETLSEMKNYFKADDMIGGIEAGILKAGHALQKYFPYQHDDINELSDEVSVDEDN